jgi:hypothetical protein
MISRKPAAARRGSPARARNRARPANRAVRAAAGQGMQRGGRGAVPAFAGGGGDLRGRRVRCQAAARSARRTCRRRTGRPGCCDGRPAQPAARRARRRVRADPQHRIACRAKLIEAVRFVRALGRSDLVAATISARAHDLGGSEVAIDDERVGLGLGRAHHHELVDVRREHFDPAARIGPGQLVVARGKRSSTATSPASPVDCQRTRSPHTSRRPRRADECRNGAAGASSTRGAGRRPRRRGPRAGSPASCPALC